MLRDRASSEADRHRFIQRVIASESVWALRGGMGFAYCESNEDDEKAVIVFWSDRAYAERARKSQFPEYEPAKIPLFDFLFRWLPGMSADGVLAGTNWTGNLIGCEVEPARLQDQITDQMPQDMLTRYLEQLKKGIA
jgi:hypothetical protein